MGIEELKDVVKSGLDIGQALSDGVQIGDLTALLSLPAAITGISDVPAEIEDMDADEKVELFEFVQANFDIPNDRLEEVIEKAIIVVLDIYKIFLIFKEIKAA